MKLFRYVKLYLYFLRFSFSKSLEFRMDFFFRIIMDIFYYVVNIAFYKIIFLHTPYLAGWNEGQMNIFIGSFLVLDAVVMTLFSNNMWWLPIFVNKGELDYYLVRPVSSLFFLSFRDFAFNSFINLLFACAILSTALMNYPGSFTLWQYGLYFFFLMGGVFLYYALRILMIIPVFWTHSSRGLDEIFWGLTRCMERPDRIYKGFMRFILVTILPFATMASFPARLLIEGIDQTIIFHLLGLIIFFSLLINFLWKMALRNYSSASS